MSYFAWGAYEHPEGEVDLYSYDVRNRLSPRGLRVSTIHTMHIGGTICAVDQPTLLTRCQEIVDEYEFDNRDAILYDNTSPTPLATTFAMYTDAADSISGTRVIHKSWPKGGYEELVTARTFSVQIQCEFEEVYDQVMSFREHLRFIGTGGARIFAVDLATGTPELQAINQYTHQRIIQYGHAVGWAGYPSYPGPIFSSPVLEHLDRREIELHGPTFRGKQYRGYEVSWRYEFSAATAQVAVPNYLY